MWTVRELLLPGETVLSDHQTKRWEAARELGAVIALRVADTSRGAERRTWRQVASYLRYRLPRDRGYSKEAFHRRLTIEQREGGE